MCVYIVQIMGVLVVYNKCVCVCVCVCESVCAYIYVCMCFTERIHHCFISEDCSCNTVTMNTCKCMEE